VEFGPWFEVRNIRSTPRDQCFVLELELCLSIPGQEISPNQHPLEKSTKIHSLENLVGVKQQAF
jgi:hypothetical protein